jgi:hypothetical protein
MLFSTDYSSVTEFTMPKQGGITFTPVHDTIIGSIKLLSGIIIRFVTLLSIDTVTSIISLHTEVLVSVLSMENEHQDDMFGTLIL